jgi:hypothetical protein
MKRIVSISLGSAKRDHQVVREFGGQSFLIERIGTDGDKDRAIALIRALDGKVEAFGLGGTDLYIYAGPRRYTFRDTARIAAAARVTPVVDGSGIKNTLERRVIRFLEKKHGMNFAEKKALVVCAVDRFGLAEALIDSTLADLPLAGTTVSLGFYPRFPENHLVLTAKSPDRAKAEAMNIPVDSMKVTSITMHMAAIGQIWKVGMPK